jgi:TonB family protein
LRRPRFPITRIIALIICGNALWAAGPKISDTPRGFEIQYQQLFSAYKKGDSKKVDRLLGEFEIPADWFTNTFGPDDGLELRQEYLGQSGDFGYSTLKRLGMFDRKMKSFVHAQFRTGNETKPEPAGVPMESPILKSIPLTQRYVIHYFVNEKERSSWMDSFIYLDGRFRFLGKGAYPFWDPTKVRLADPCAQPGSAPSGKLIYRVEPAYSEAARQKHLEGIVRMRVTVATDGSVQAVEIVEGDPLLAELAKQAVLKWRYSPFMNCGTPVEMRSMEHVKFPPPS